MKLRQLLPYAVMLAVSAALYWAAARIDVDTGGRIGPGVWPKTIIVIMALLCAYEIVKRLVAKTSLDAESLIAGLTEKPELPSPPTPLPGERGETAPSPLGEGGGEGLSEQPGKLVGGIALVTAYVIAVPWLGFFVTTALFLGIFPWIGGLRRPVLAATLGIAGSFFLVVVFMRVAYISLPLGEGPFRALTLLLLRTIGVS